MTNKWKDRLENLGVLAAAVALGLVTLVLVLMGLDWLDTL